MRFYVESGRRLYDRAHARAIFERYRERRIHDGTFAVSKPRRLTGS